MSDTISRQSAVDALNEYFARIGKLKRIGLTRGEKAISLDTVGAIKTLPTIQPDNGLQKLADEIASFKRCVKSENSDYLTGYLSALSVVEGMIADMREVNNESN